MKYDISMMEMMRREYHRKNIFHFYSLIVLGIATSIDALAIGISLTATTPSIFFLQS